MVANEQEWYPKVRLRIGETAWNSHEMREKCAILEADLDLGVPDLFISGNALEKVGIRQGIFNFKRSATIGGKSFLFYTKKFKVALIGTTSESRSIEIPCHIVENFEDSPFAAVNPNRQALAGRSVLKWFGAIVEIDATKNETRILLQNWQGFEKEVANLYRALGLKVHRNVNLSGNQIDVE